MYLMYTTKRCEVNGVLHNNSGPAIVYANGSREYWVHGKRHAHGPAVIHVDGSCITKEYWRDGKRHRIGGPARFTIGKPSVDDPSSQLGSSTDEYWVDGIQYTDCTCRVSMHANDDFYIIPFSLYPGSYQPSGTVNFSRAREIFIDYFR